MKLRTYISAALVIAFSACFAAPVHGAGAPEKDCAVDTYAQALTALKNHPSTDEFEAIQAELAVRRNMLRVVVRCAKRDIEASEKAVRALSVKSENDRQIQNEISDRIHDVLRDKNLDEGRINDLGLRATKDAAKEIKDLRIRIFLPLKERAENFALWMKSALLIGTAENRLRDISKALAFLGIADKEDVADLLKGAGEHLGEARALHEKVRPLFERPGTSEEISLAIKAALDALSRGYQNFFAISGEVKKLVPL